MTDKPLLNLTEHADLDSIVMANPWISTLSKWSDPTWEFDVVSPGYSSRRLAMSWRVVAPAKAINEMKYLVALLFIGRYGEGSMKQTGAGVFGVAVRYLLRFMQEHSFDSVEQLDTAAFDLFQRHIKETLTDPVGLANAEAEDAAAGEQADREATEQASLARHRNKLGNRGRGVRTPAKVADDQEEISTDVATLRLTVWRCLRDEGEDLRRVGINVPRFDPFKSTSCRSMGEALGSYSAERIPPLPDAVARPIIEFAHRMIGVPAEDVIRLHDSYFEHLRKTYGDDTERDRAGERLVKSATFSTIEGETGPWTNRRLQSRTNGAATVREFITLVRDAAIIVLQSDTGIRISEICSIEIDDIDDDAALPSCVSVEPSSTQLNEHFFVHGILSKGVRDPRSEKWLLGGRPCGTDVEPSSVRALRILMRLLRPWRRLPSDQKLRRQLLPSSLAYEFLPAVSADIGPPSASALCRSMVNTIESEVNLRAKLENLKSDPEIEPYWKENGRCIRPHQWRKTFIRYLIRVDEGLLPAISHHFKHYSLAITEDGYMPRDPELIEMANGVRTRESSRALYERRFGSKHRIGRLDDLLEETRSRLREIIGDDDFARAAPRLDAFIREHDLQFWFAQHGACLFDMHPSEARCHADMGQSDWKWRGPEFTTRTPDACLGCKNFSAGPEALGFWKKRYVTNQQSWITSGYAPAFRVARMRAKQSAAILRHLGQPLPVILARPPRNRAVREKKDAA